MDRILDLDAPSCGQCAHMEQLRSGLWRVCEIKRALVDATSCDVCGHYKGIWTRDLFGQFTEYQLTLAYQRKHQKKFEI